MPWPREQIEKLKKLTEARATTRREFETDAELRKRLMLMEEFDLSPQEVFENNHAPESPEFLKELKDL